MQKKQAFLSHVPNTLKERFCAQHCIMQVAGRMMHAAVEKAQAEVAKRKSRGLYMAAPTHWTQALSLSAESGGPASETSGTLARTRAHVPWPMDIHIKNLRLAYTCCRVPPWPESRGDATAERSLDLVGLGTAEV